MQSAWWNSTIVTRVTTATNVTTAARATVITTATTATEASRNCWLHKILEVDVPTSQSLKVAYLRFEAQKLIHLSKAVIHTSHQPVYSHSTATTSCCNENKLLDYHQCLKDFATILLALNTEPVFLDIWSLFTCPKREYLTGDYYFATFIRRSHCLTLDGQPCLKTSYTLMYPYSTGQRVYTSRL